MDKRKPDGYWKDKDNVIKALRKIMKRKKIDYVPNAKRLIHLGYVSVAYAIEQHHGGFRAFRKSVGEDQRIADKGQWKSLEFVLNETKSILEHHNLDCLPETKKLIELGHHDYVAGVQRYHGGLQKIREKLGHKQYMHKRKVWQNEEFVIGEALRVMNELNLEELPSTRVLHSHGYSTFGSSIVRYHGGMVSFKEKLRKYQSKLSHKEEVEILLEAYIHG